jgi:hypothetical protein
MNGETYGGITEIKELENKREAEASLFNAYSSNEERAKSIRD